MNFYNFHPLIAEIVDYNTRYNIQLPEGINWNCDENQNIVGIYKDDNIMLDIQQYGIYIRREICQLYKSRIKEEMREERVYHFGEIVNIPWSINEDFRKHLKLIPLKKGVRRVYLGEEITGITQDENSRFSIIKYGKYLQHKIYKKIRARQLGVVV